jgi:glucokinase
MGNTIKNRVIGIDVGVKHTTIAVVDQRGNILGTDSFPTTDYPDVNNFLTILSERIVVLAEANGGFENIRSVGMSAPSSNYLTGCIENAGNIPWKGVIPLAAMLRDRIGLAVALGNDAHITALGEHVYGAAHGMQNFIVVSFGHGGLGSCMFSNGLPHLGANGSAGEMGHSCMVDGGRQCTCGRKGCLEAYVVDRGMVQTAEELMAETDEPSLMRALETLTPQAIALCCEQGDELALEVFRRTGEILGLGLANVASILDPEAIILADYPEEVLKWLIAPTKESFDKYVFRNIKDRVKLVVSELKNSERDVLGAAALAWTVKEYSLFK